MKNKGNQNASKGGRTASLSVRVTPEVKAWVESQPGTQADVIERLVTRAMKILNTTLAEVK